MAYNYPWLDDILSNYEYPVINKNKKEQKQEDPVLTCFKDIEENSVRSAIRNEEFKKLIAVLRSIFGKKWNENCVKRLKRINILPDKKNNYQPYEDSNEYSRHWEMWNQSDFLYWYVLLQGGKGKLKMTEGDAQKVMRLFGAIAQTSNSVKKLSQTVVAGINKCFTEAVDSYYGHKVEEATYRDFSKLLEKIIKEYTLYREQSNYQAENDPVVEPFLNEAKAANAIFNRLCNELRSKTLKDQQQESYAYLNNGDCLNQMESLEYQFLSTVYSMVFFQVINVEENNWAKVQANVRWKIAEALEEFSDCPAVLFYMNVSMNNCSYEIQNILLLLREPLACNSILMIQEMYTVMENIESIGTSADLRDLKKLEEKITDVYKCYNCYPTEHHEEEPGVPQYQWSDIKKNSEIFWMDSILMEHDQEVDGVYTTFELLSDKEKKTIREREFWRLIEILRSLFGEYWQEDCVKHLASASYTGKDLLNYQDSEEYKIYFEYSRLIDRCINLKYKLTEKMKKMQRIPRIPRAPRAPRIRRIRRIPRMRRIRRIPMQPLFYQEDFQKIKDLYIDIIELVRDSNPLNMETIDKYYQRAAAIYPEMVSASIESDCEFRELFIRFKDAYSFSYDDHLSELDSNVEFVSLVYGFFEVAQKDIAQQYNCLWEKVCKLSNYAGEGDSACVCGKYISTAEYEFLRDLYNVIRKSGLSPSNIKWKEVNPKMCQKIYDDIKVLSEEITLFYYMKLNRSRQKEELEEFFLSRKYPVVWRINQMLKEMNDRLCEDQLLSAYTDQKKKLFGWYVREAYDCYCRMIRYAEQNIPEPELDPELAWNQMLEQTFWAREESRKSLKNENAVNEDA